MPRLSPSIIDLSGSTAFPTFATLRRAKAEVELYLVDYNRHRPHSFLRYQTPESFGVIARREVPPSAGAADLPRFVQGRHAERVGHA